MRFIIDHNMKTIATATNLSLFRLIYVIDKADFLSFYIQTPARALTNRL
jgi:hypothetical protein